MKKGIRGHDVEVVGLKAIHERCAEQGLAYLQLVLEKSVEGFVHGQFTAAYAKRMQAQLGDTKIAILGSYINPSNPEDEALKAEIEKFKEKIKYAAILKPIAVGTETGRYQEGLTDSPMAYQRVLATMRELVAEAERYGVTIGIEGVHCFVINTPQKMKRLVDDLNSDHVKVIFDPINYLNIHNYGQQDEMIAEMFTLLADKICAVHLKDFVVKDGKLAPVNITEGIFNYPLLLQKLEAYHLDVPMICEGYADREAVIALERLNQMRTCEA